VEFTVISAMAGVFTNPKGSAFVSSLAQAFEDVYHVRAGYFFAPGSTDAMHLYSGGLKNVVVFGPGGGNAHDKDEFLLLEQLVKTCKVYLLLAYRLLCKPSLA
jgi:acetylornithine deacetylase/succinyl-diaminopimelate desuccinylase-like protein